MKAKTLIVSTLTAALLTGGAVFASDLRHNEVYQLRESGRIMAMEDILAHARKAQAGHLIEAELEREDGRYVYELKILDAQGGVHELELDAASGEVLKRKTKD